MFHALFQLFLSLKVDTHLEACTFACNTSKQESSKYCPFELMFGRKPVLLVELDVAGETSETLVSDFSPKA